MHNFYGRIILSWLDSKGFQFKIYDICLILRELLGGQNLFWCVWSLKEIFHEVFTVPQWPRGLRRGFAAAFFAGVAASNRIPLGVWMSVLVSVVCCQAEVSASGRLLMQRRPTECGVSECGYM